MLTCRCRRAATGKSWPGREAGHISIGIRLVHVSGACLCESASERTSWASLRQPSCPHRTCANGRRVRAGPRCNTLSPSASPCVATPQHAFSPKSRQTHGQISAAQRHSISRPLIGHHQQGPTVRWVPLSQQTPRLLFSRTLFWAYRFCPGPGLWGEAPLFLRLYFPLLRSFVSSTCSEAVVCRGGGLPWLAGRSAG